MFERRIIEAVEMQQAVHRKQRQFMRYRHAAFSRLSARRIH